jgi:glycosyltransferase involved in cell wall biosynthesis
VDGRSSINLEFDPSRDVAGQFPGTDVRHIHMGVPDPLASVTTPAEEVRRRHGIPADAVVFGSFGRVTPEKGLSAVLRVLAQLARALPAIRLLIVGVTSPYFDLMAEARALGVADRVIEAGYVSDEALPDYLAAVDVCLALRWPTGRETSAAWLRCVAAGRPTVVTDLVHTTDVPGLDLRSMKVACTDASETEPVCVHVDLIDEVNTLRLALRRLTEDAELRTRLGSAARRYWSRGATMELMALDYERALARAACLPDPPRPAGWPAHLRADGTSTARALAAHVGVPFPFDPPATGRL